MHYIFRRASRLCLLLLSFSTVIFPMEGKFKYVPTGEVILLHQDLGLVKELFKEKKKVPTHGFPSSTLVFTPEGMKPIKYVKKDDQVMSYDRFTQLFTASKVIKNHREKHENFMRLRAGDQEIDTQEDQQFLGQDHEWHKVSDLDDDTRLLTYDMQTLPVTGVEKVNGKKTFYELSLEGGPRNFAIGDKKLIAHNVTIVAAMSGLALGAKALRAGYHALCAWRGNRDAENTLKQVMEYYASQGLGEELGRLTLNEIMQHESIERIPKPILDQLGRICHKYGLGARLSDCTLDEIAQFHVSGALRAVAVQEHYGNMTPTSIASDIGNATLSGATRGVIGAGISLTLNLAAGNVDGVRDAAAIVIKPVATSAVISGAWEGGKDIALHIGAKTAPVLTEKILPYIPVVGTVWNAYTAARDIYYVGGGVRALLKNKKGPSAIPQGGGGGSGSSSSSSSGGGSNGGGGGGGKGGGQGDATAAGGAGYAIAKGAAKALSDKKEEIKQVGRVVNKMSKTEFFKLDWVKGSVRHVKENGGQYYEIIKPLRGVTEKGAKYIRWDYTHNDVEVLKSLKGKGDLGSWAPTQETLVWVKKALKNRIIG